MHNFQKVIIFFRLIFYYILISYINLKCHFPHRHMKIHQPPSILVIMISIIFCPHQNVLKFIQQRDSKIEPFIFLEQIKHIDLGLSSTLSFPPYT